MARTTRDLLLDAAIQLFARQGYKTTTISQIEKAAGLSPGSGGLYRHFRSKQQVLEAAIDRARVNQTVPSYEDDRLFDLDHPERGLRAAGEFGLAASRADGPLYSLLLRPTDELPLEGAFADIQMELLSGGVVRLARWIELYTKAGRFRQVDELATARTALGALSWFHFTHDILAVKVAGIEEERFLDNWVDVWLTYLTVGVVPV